MGQHPRVCTALKILITMAYDGEDVMERVARKRAALIEAEEEEEERLAAASAGMIGC